MARIAIVGGHGKIALELTKQLVARGDTPVGLVRKDAYVGELGELGAEAVLLDIESANEDEFAAAFEGADAVVFAAGGGADGNIDRKKSVDYAGSVKSATGAAKAGVSRFVQISAISVDEPLPSDAGDVWAAYVEAKRDADSKLRETALDWTILRPGGLTDDPGTGQVRLADKVEREQVPRADVAALVVAVLAEPGSIGKTWEVVSGDQPIADAVAANV